MENIIRSVMDNIIKEASSDDPNVAILRYLTTAYKALMQVQITRDIISLNIPKDHLPHSVLVFLIDE